MWWDLAQLLLFVLLRDSTDLFIGHVGRQQSAYVQVMSCKFFRKVAFIQIWYQTRREPFACFDSRLSEHCSYFEHYHFRSGKVVRLTQDHKPTDPKEEETHKESRRGYHPTFTGTPKSQFKTWYESQYWRCGAQSVLELPVSLTPAIFRLGNVLQ